MNYSDADYNLTAINADGIYLATCSALLLCLQLMKAGHYEDLEVSWKVRLFSNTRIRFHWNAVVHPARIVCFIHFAVGYTYTVQSNRIGMTIAYSLRSFKIYQQ